MRELRTAPIIANEVSMLRAAMRGPIVLVEGDSDTRLYREFLLPSPYVRVTHCDGKPILLDAMEMIAGRNIRGVVAICDADFDRVIGRTVPYNILQADSHDAEMMIARSAGLKRAFEEIYEISFEAHEFQTIRDYLLNISARIGSIRLWNTENASRLKFQGLNPGDFLDADEGFLYTDYVRRLLEESFSSSEDLGDILDLIRDYRSDVDSFELSCGHDFTALLDADAAIKGERSRYGPEVIEKMLRLGFSATNFSETQLARALGEWEKTADVDLLADSIFLSE